MDALSYRFIIIKFVMIEIALDAVKKAEKELLNYKDNPMIISEKKEI